MYKDNCWKEDNTPFQYEACWLGVAPCGLGKSFHFICAIHTALLFDAIAIPQLFPQFSISLTMHWNTLRHIASPLLVWMQHRSWTSQSDTRCYQHVLRKCMNGAHQVQPFPSVNEVTTFRVETLREGQQRVTTSDSRRGSDNLSLISTVKWMPR